MEISTNNETVAHNLKTSDENNEKEGGTEDKILRTENSDSAPISHYVIWGVTILLWPMAGGLLTYVSLKKLWKETASYAIITAVILSIIISYALMVPLADVEIQWIVIQAPMAMIFIFLQYTAVNEWAIKYPNIKYRNNPKDAGWALLWLILYYVIAFIVALFIV